MRSLVCSVDEDSAFNRDHEVELIKQVPERVFTITPHIDSVPPKVRLVTLFPSAPCRVEVLIITKVASLRRGFENKSKSAST